MKIKTNELTGAHLNKAVAFAVEMDKKFPIMPLRVLPYSTVWEYAGPIIERNHIALDYYPDGSYDNGGMWLAVITRGAEDGVEDGIEQIAGEGPTPLVAAMRCFAASRLGEEVEVPDDMEN